MVGTPLELTPIEEQISARAKDFDLGPLLRLRSDDQLVGEGGAEQRR